MRIELSISRRPAILRHSNGGPAATGRWAAKILRKTANSACSRHDAPDPYVAVEDLSKREVRIRGEVSGDLGREPGIGNGRPHPSGHHRHRSGVRHQRTRATRGADPSHSAQRKSKEAFH